MANDHILIVGAGLCGSLLALRMAQRGYKVSLYEKRGDLRREELAAGRSINLALSGRGLWALRQAGMEDAILEQCIPMKGRLIHPLGAAPFLSPYSGRPADYINSVSREGLNTALLDKADEFSSISLHFNHKCLHVDLQRPQATFRNQTTDETVHVKADVVIGTDGAGSAVRRSLMGATSELLFDYSQHFLKHGYKELSIKATDTGNYRIEKNALHIWPRGDFMIIALPNLDGSFTLTMFNPMHGPNGFSSLHTESEVVGFFEEQFPDLIEHCPHYTEEFFDNPVGILGTIKCYPWQAYGKTLIMGDAAHAIVPFYGQGMNASFEDVRIFNNILDDAGDNWEKVFRLFQDQRVANTNAIADLAIDNFHEMQERVDDPDFIKKRQLEMRLEENFPRYYSKYSLVTFKPDLPYVKAMKLGRAQDQYLLKICQQQANVADIDLKEIFQGLQELRSAIIE